MSKKQGRFPQYAEPGGIVGRSQVSYGEDETEEQVQSLQQSVVQVGDLSPIMMMFLIHDSSVFTVERQAGATLVSQTPGSGTLELIFQLAVPIGEDVRVGCHLTTAFGAVNAYANNVQAESQNGGTRIRVALTMVLAASGAAYDPGEDDELTITVYHGSKP